MKMHLRILIGTAILAFITVLPSGCQEEEQTEFFSVEPQDTINAIAEPVEDQPDSQTTTQTTEPQPPVQTAVEPQEPKPQEQPKPQPSTPQEPKPQEQPKPQPSTQQEPKPQEQPKPQPSLPQPAVEAKPAPAQTTQEPEKSTEILVTINGLDITQGDVMQRIEPQLKRIRTQLPPEMLEQYLPKLKEQAIESIIVERLLDEQIKNANIIVTDQDVLNHLTRKGTEQATPMSLEEIKQLIESQGQNFEDVKKRLQKKLSYQKLIESQPAEQVTVTEEEARKFYSENQSRFQSPEQVKASHILIKLDTSDPNADPNEAGTKAKTKAEKLLKQIYDGQNFAELAKANSDCPSAAKGGDLGFFEKSRMVKPFADTAFNLKVGQVSNIVKTRFGYHIIKVTDRKDAVLTSFDDAKDNIVNMLTNRKRNDIAKDYIESLKKQADIVYHFDRKTMPGISRPPAAGQK